MRFHNVVLLLALPASLHCFVLTPSYVGNPALRSHTHALLRPPPLASFSTRQLRLPATRERFALRCSEEPNEVADGVTLPVDGIDFNKQKAWVADEIATWLDKEWIPRDIHREIGEAAGSVVLEAREEGMHDASGILFKVATDLETFDFYESDVNNWDIANKVSDLLLQSTGKDVCCTSPPNTTPDFSIEEEEDEEEEPEQQHTSGSSHHPEAGQPISLPQDPFDKYQFLQQALDGRVGQGVLSHAVLLSLGFKPVPDAVAGSMGYDSSEVEDSRWKRFAPHPDFFTGMEAIECLDACLQAVLEDENKREEELDALIEAVYGEAAMQIARENGDEDYLRRETCVKWLHLVGGY